MRISVKVVPKSSVNSMEELSPGQYKVKVTDPPVDGKANKAVIKLLAKHFEVRKSDVDLVSGDTYRSKVFEIEKD